MFLRNLQFLLATVVAAWLFSGSVLAQGPSPKLWWPEFLGPERNGISREKGLNFDWKKTPPKVVWKVPLGDAFSSMSIVGDRLYTFAKRRRRDVAVCLDTATGTKIWQQDLAPDYIDRQKQGPGPRSTPTYDNGKLYCLLPLGELFCLAAADGKVLWTADQFKDTGAPNPANEYFYWGASLSPLVEGDLVVVQPGGKDKNSVAAYHKDTGKLAWTCGSDGPCYASPLAVTIQGVRQIIVPTGDSVLGIEPKRGEILWRYEFGNKFRATCATPVWTGDALFFSVAYGTGSVLLDVTQKDGKWQVAEKWRNKKNLQTLFATAIVADGSIYGCSGDLGAMMLKCLDLKTGEVRWDSRMADRQMLLGVDGHLLCWGENGTLTLVEMQPQAYVQKGELPNLLRPRAWAAPALANGRLYLRDQREILCLDLHKPS